MNADLRCLRDPPGGNTCWAAGEHTGRSGTDCHRAREEGGPTWPTGASTSFHRADRPFKAGVGGDSLGPSGKGIPPLFGTEFFSPLICSVPYPRSCPGFGYFPSFFSVGYKSLESEYRLNPLISFIWENIPPTSAHIQL